MYGIQNNNKFPYVSSFLVLYFKGGNCLVNIASVQFNLQLIVGRYDKFSVKDNKFRVYITSTCPNKTPRIGPVRITALPGQTGNHRAIKGSDINFSARKTAIVFCHYLAIDGHQIQHNVFYWTDIWWLRKRQVISDTFYQNENDIEI